MESNEVNNTRTVRAYDGRPQLAACNEPPAGAHEGRPYMRMWSGAASLGLMGLIVREHQGQVEAAVPRQGEADAFVDGDGC
jgi:hypothetical protein